MTETNCINCGKPHGKGRKHSPYCQDCAWQRAMDSARQLQEKSGPFYEKWKARLMESVK